LVFTPPPPPLAQQVVKTELRVVGDAFELHTPSADADKCWISYADDAEVTT
jgi:hypothetical protein